MNNVLNEAEGRERHSYPRPLSLLFNKKLCYYPWKAIKKLLMKKEKKDIITHFSAVLRETQC